jgi:hypothetical protein
MQRADILPQKLHTNVSVVRMKKNGCRFEIACYRNTVMAWRDKMYASLRPTPTARFRVLGHAHAHARVHPLV